MGYMADGIYGRRLDDGVRRWSKPRWFDVPEQPLWVIAAIGMHIGRCHGTVGKALCSDGPKECPTPICVRRLAGRCPDGNDWAMGYARRSSLVVLSGSVVLMAPLAFNFEMSRYPRVSPVRTPTRLICHGDGHSDLGLYSDGGTRWYGECSISVTSCKATRQ